MEIFETIQIIANAVFLISILMFGKYLRSYLAEKGKNAASKEDIEHLTKSVESVKHEYTAQIERLKSELQDELHVIERRRRIYEEICNSMRVFIAGNGASDEAKDRFLAAYSSAWLWSSDRVLTLLNVFVDLQIKHAKQPTSNDGFVLECA
ncbi:hypothetical protein QLH52_11175 [Methylomonas sp. OY6]|uniref:Uncharacterized protein n=1 Tax=Methylomonas defluvii TaxID=3045149 RepID=A0ABU4UGL1_9GAMM|nr:hypothetical protein [Methylomonas sp. OY6]MDX8127844.1 hypothetical protein [Methylomonas sp. OY6]